MIFTGSVFHRMDRVLATVEVSESAGYVWVEIKVATSVVVKFPLPTGSDINEIKLRTQNILNQTGVVNPPARVELAPVE